MILRGFVILHCKVEVQNDRFYSLLATENESLSHHSSDAPSFFVLRRMV